MSFNNNESEFQVISTFLAQTNLPVFLAYILWMLLSSNVCTKGKNGEQKQRTDFNWNFKAKALF